MKTWRWKAAERRGGVKEPRAVLSIAFPASLFDLVDRAAEAQRVYTSAFVREAAIERARRVLGDTDRPEAASDSGARGGERVPFGGDHTRTFVSGHLP